MIHYYMLNNKQIAIIKYIFSMSSSIFRFLQVLIVIRLKIVNMLGEYIFLL